METLLLYGKDKNSCDASRFLCYNYLNLLYLHDLSAQISFDIWIIFIKLKPKTDEGWNRVWMLKKYQCFVFWMEQIKNLLFQFIKEHIAGSMRIVKRC